MSIMDHKYRGVRFTAFEDIKAGELVIIEAWPMPGNSDKEILTVRKAGYAKRDDKRYCVNCKHCKNKSVNRPDLVTINYFYCHQQENYPEHDVVTGEPRYEIADCSHSRSTLGRCKPEGRLFEPKENP